MPSMGGGSHVTGPETCGPPLLPNPDLRQDKGCQWAAKIRSLPCVCWNVTILDTEASWNISGWRNSPGFKDVTDLNFCSRVAPLLVGSDVPSRVLSPAFRPVLRQPTNTTIWANLSNTSPQVSHEHYLHVQHVFRFAGQTNIRFGTPRICRPEASFCWCLIYVSLCLISLKRLSEIGDMNHLPSNWVH